MKFVSLLLVLVLVVSCQSTQQSDTVKSSESSWSTKMQLLAIRLNVLLPYIYSKENFADPKRREWLEREIRHFHSDLRNVEKHSSKNLPDNDPSLKLTVTRLTSEVETAYEGLRGGYTEYSRSLLKSAVGHCYYCHTRNKLGPQYDLGFDSFNMKQLKKSEQVDYLVATRQFDRAISRISEQLASPKSDFASSFDNERLLRKYMVLALRVKEDPKVAERGLDLVIKNENPNSYIVSNAKVWKNSLKSWKTWSRQKGSKLASAKSLIAKARVMQEYPFDNSADVLYLKASVFLHDYLKENLTAKQYSEASYYLGLCYEVIKDAGAWNLNEVYYEACIRRTPNSNLSQKCFKRFERSLLLGYSGSAGTHVPMTARLRLEELRKLAFSNIKK